MTDIVLCNISDANDVVKEERNSWTKDVLLSLGISEEILLLSTDIDEYLHHMNQYGIEVELKTSGEILIYKKVMQLDENGDEIDWLPSLPDHLVAHWKLPTFIRKVDGRDVYYEIHLNKWSSV